MKISVSQNQENKMLNVKNSFLKKKEQGKTIKISLENQKVRDELIIEI